MRLLSFFDSLRRSACSGLLHTTRKCLVALAVLVVAGLSPASAEAQTRFLDRMQAQQAQQATQQPPSRWGTRC